MKVLLTVTLLIFFASFELSSGQLRDCLNPLDTHYMSNCADPDGPNGRPSAAFMGPCFDTPTCKIPKCCGIISGRDSVVKIEYEAEVPLSNGTFNGNLGGIGIGKAVAGCENQMLAINLPIGQIIVPPTLAGYDRTLCTQSKCPQVVGGKYVLEIPFRFITTAVSTFDLIKVQFVAEIETECGEQALCWGIWATLVSADLVDSVVGTVKSVAENPLEALTNLDKTLERPLAGVIGRKNTNPFKYPKSCPPEPTCRKL